MLDGSARFRAVAEEISQFGEVENREVLESRRSLDGWKQFVKFPSQMCDLEYVRFNIEFY